MFELVAVVICLGTADIHYSCVKVTDNWGPYRTERKCEKRADQILDVFINSYGPLAMRHGVFRRYKCKKTGINASVQPVALEVT